MPRHLPGWPLPVADTDMAPSPIGGYGHHTDMTVTAIAPLTSEYLNKIGAPERSRTPNPQIRSLVLYPIELRARAEQPSGLRELQIATPAGGGKQGGSKGRSEGVLHSDDHDPRIAKFISQIPEPVG